MSTAMLVSAGACLLVAMVGWLALWKHGADLKSGVEHLALSVRPLQAFLLAGGLALLAARLSDAWRRGLAAVGSTAVLGPVLLQTGMLAGCVPSARFADPLQWYVGDVEKVASLLQARSMGQDAAVRHLWTNQSVDVLSFLSSYLSPHLSSPDGMNDLMVLKVPSRLVPSSLPPGWSQMHSDTPGATLLLHEFRSQIDLENVGVWSTDLNGQMRHFAFTRTTGNTTSDYERSVDFRWKRVDNTEPPHSFRVLRDVGAEGPASSSCGLGCAYAELVATTLDGQAHEVTCHTLQPSEKGVIVRAVGPTGAQTGPRWRRDFRPDLVEFTPEDADLLGAVFPPREAWTCR